jgi:long-chain acyl-CoA synthetase
VDALPVYIHGTHEALPPGSAVPRKTRLRVVIGQPVCVADLEARTAALAKGDAHKAATQIMEEAVKALRRTTLAEPEPERAPEPAPGRTAAAPAPAGSEAPGPAKGRAKSKDAPPADAVPGMKARGEEP